MLRYFCLFLSCLSTLTLAQVKIADIFSHGTVDEVRAILEAGHGVNQRLDRVDFRDPAGYNATPLILASESNSTDVVKLLIDSGADVNENLWDSTTYTSFIAATRNKDIKVMHLLLDSGADFAKQSERAFLWAASVANGEAIQFLLDKGLDIQHDPELLEKALTYALQNGEDTILETLIDLGAVIDEQDIFTAMNKLESLQILLAHGGELTQFMATQALLQGVEDERVIPTLLSKGVYANVRSDDGETPLMAAAARHQPEGVKTLLNAGADVNAVAHHGGNTLLRAVYCYELQYAKDIEKANIDTVKTVRVLLEAGADVNYAAPSGAPALMSAASQINCPIEIVALLLEAGANVDDVNHYGEGALMNASDAAFDLLMEYNPDINAQDERGLSVLSRNIMHPRSIGVFDLKRAEALLARGADPNIVDNQGETAILRAMELQEPLEAFRLLLQYGADVHIKDKYNKSLLLHAVANPNAIEVVRELIDLGLDVNDPDSNILANAANLEITKLLLNAGADIRTQGGPALLSAAHDEDKDRLNFLIDVGADINYQYKHRSSISTPIISRAVQWGDVELLKKLIENGANTELRDETGRTPLLWAAYSSDDYRNLDYFNLEINRLLIEAGADVNAQAFPNKYADDEDLVFISDTALIQGVRRGSIELAEMLLGAGADVNAQNDKGATALMVASQADHHDLMKLLIEAGADLAIRDIQGKTALNFTIYGTAAYQILGGNTLDLDIFDYVRHADAESLGAILDNTGVDVNIVDLYGQPLLIYAAGKNPDPEVIEFLVDHGANVNQSDIYGWTALMHATRDNKNPDVLKALVRAGADLEQRNTRTMTAVMVAAENARADSLKVLIELGADLKACSKYWYGDGCAYTALDYAAIGGDVETLGTLLELEQDIINLDWLLTRALDKNTHVETVKALIALGADPKFEVYYGHNEGFAYNMLGKAIGSNSLEKVKILVLEGVSVNDRSDHRSTPLAQAASKGNVPMMQYLLDMGAQPSKEVLENYRSYRTNKYENPNGQYDYNFEKKLIELTLN